MLHVGATVCQGEMPATLICLPIVHHPSYPAGYSDLISKHRTKAGQLLGSLPSISPFQGGGQTAGAKQIQVANLPATFHLLPHPGSTHASSFSNHQYHQVLTPSSAITFLGQNLLHLSNGGQFVVSLVNGPHGSLHSASDLSFRLWLCADPPSYYLPWPFP